MVPLIAIIKYFIDINYNKNMFKYCSNASLTQLHLILIAYNFYHYLHHCVLPLFFAFASHCVSSATSCCSFFGFRFSLLRVAAVAVAAPTVAVVLAHVQCLCNHANNLTFESN